MSPCGLTSSWQLITSHGLGFKFASAHFPRLRFTIRACIALTLCRLTSPPSPIHLLPPYHPRPQTVNNFQTAHAVACLDENTRGRLANGLYCNFRMAGFESGSRQGEGPFISLNRVVVVVVFKCFLVQPCPLRKIRVALPGQGTAAA